MNKLFQLIAISVLLVASQSYTTQVEMEVNLEQEAQELNAELDTLYKKVLEEWEKEKPTVDFSDDIVDLLVKHAHRWQLNPTENSYNIYRTVMNKSPFLARKKDGETIDLHAAWLAIDVTPEQAALRKKYKDKELPYLGNCMKCYNTDNMWNYPRPIIYCDLDKKIARQFRERVAKK